MEICTRADVPYNFANQFVDQLVNLENGSLLFVEIVTQFVGSHHGAYQPAHG